MRTEVLETGDGPGEHMDEAGPEEDPAGERVPQGERPLPPLGLSHADREQSADQSRGEDAGERDHLEQDHQTSIVNHPNVLHGDVARRLGRQAKDRLRRKEPLLRRERPQGIHDRRAVGPHALDHQRVAFPRAQNGDLERGHAVGDLVLDEHLVMAQGALGTAVRRDATPLASCQRHQHKTQHDAAHVDNRHSSSPSRTSMHGSIVHERPFRRRTTTGSLLVVVLVPVLIRRRMIRGGLFENVLLHEDVGAHLDR